MSVESLISTKKKGRDQRRIVSHKSNKKYNVTSALCKSILDSLTKGGTKCD